MIRLRKQISRTGSRTLVYLADRTITNALRDVVFFWASGIRKVIGAPFNRDLRPIPNPHTGYYELESKRLALCLKTLGEIDIDDLTMWDLRISSSEFSVADRALAPLRNSPFIAINIGGKDASKLWGEKNWQALLNLLNDSLSHFALVFVGSADEFELSNSIAKFWPGASLNLCGKLDPRQSAAAMSQACFFVGHDSGPMHLAAAVGTPCVAVFGSGNAPFRWHPHGRHHRIVHDIRGVRHISPQTVASAIHSLPATDSRARLPGPTEPTTLS